MTDDLRVRQLRLVVTTEDYAAALGFYRDVLGMPELGAFTSADGGHVTILDAGRATLEITDPVNAAAIDAIEVGRRVAGHLRVAIEVADTAAATERALAAGATLVAPPTGTPWRSLNARLEAPGDLQLTLFQNLEPES